MMAKRVFEWQPQFKMMKKLLWVYGMAFILRTTYFLREKKNVFIFLS